MYDIIGDIHGYATKLVSMLKKLGYTQDLVGNWFHATRKAVFVGDFINKGPEIKETVAIVRGMVEAGYGMAILGNHELLMLGENQQSYYSTLASYENDHEQMNSDREWLFTLPLTLDLGGCRVVHAFWDSRSIQTIFRYAPGAVLSSDFYNQSNDNHQLIDAVRLVSQGPYYLPESNEEIRQKGIDTKAIRMRWWQMSLDLYPPSEPPLFFGHYCLNDEVELISTNICCLDFCTYTTGRLTAYRWDGESELSDDKLVVFI